VVKEAVQSARRESNPPYRRGRAVPGPLGHGHIKQGWKESNLLAPVLEAGHSPGAHPCILPCATPALALHAFMYGAAGRLLQTSSVRTAGFEPALWWFQATRPLQAGPRPEFGPVRVAQAVEHGASAVPPRGRVEKRPRRESNPHALAGTRFTAG